MRRFALLLGPFALTALGYGALATSETACTTHQCDPHPRDENDAIATADGGRTYRTGKSLDPDTWESGDVSDDWLAFGPQAYLTFHVPDFAGRTLVSTEAYVSASPHPTSDGENWTAAAGNIAELTGYNPSVVYDPNASDPLLRNPQMVVTAHNDTCGSYYLRLVLRVAPADGGPLDAGVIDAGVIDAGVIDGGVDDAGDARADQ